MNQKSDSGGEFEGKVALITGGARGIGKSIALALGNRGARLALNDVSESELRKTVEECRKAGIDCEGFVADISSAEAVGRMVEDILPRMSKIDILVNNAGIATPTDFLNLGELEWDRLLSVNLKGAFFLTQKVIADMLSRKSEGRIIMIASVAGKSGGVATSLAYDVSKAGMIVMARSLARRYSKEGITVNAVAPSFVDTSMLGDLNLLDSKEELTKLNVIPRLAMPD
ncbi:MAG: SDR family NAD(P)-dependent oxidoreductase, partial [Nitrososphaerales archaeon]